MTEGFGTPAPAAQTCYHHPDRPTYITCARCARPICPECMRSAPVGFQCPDCVGQAARTMRQPVTISGGAVITKPYVTWTLIGLTVTVFLWQVATGIGAVAEDFGMWPFGIALYGEGWRLITAAFLHGSWLHIAFNMYVLFVLGPTLERALGHVRFVVLYLVAALGGSVASYVFSDPRTVSVGASGAIFGLMGALIVAGRRMRWDITQVLVLLGINVVIGFLSPDVDWRAHFGGLVVGALVAGVLVWTPAPLRSARVLWQVLGVAAILGVLVATTMWRTGQLWDLVAPLGVT
ncbi:MAG: rhomboid family intramembrane serine protease [Candidatus Nanopelagicales bacterium]|nr:rhomboid family intramembrane serine protease [Candidatus Nanopelagicales bacterium]MDP4975385.1 rhomboid family intramembrane serine protease [Candidatus Nanopelagicales bacterium]MDP5094330.1 rhomboid family intramembrane serine protease [Candidatus Nanopelagicales bacterium]